MNGEPSEALNHRSDCPIGQYLATMSTLNDPTEEAHRRFVKGRLDSMDSRLAAVTAVAERLDRLIARPWWRRWLSA
jgi:hypothetical protein